MFTLSSKQPLNDEMYQNSHDQDESTERISMETLDHILEAKRKQLLKDRILGGNQNVLISRQQMKKNNVKDTKSWKHFFINMKTKRYFSIIIYVFIGIFIYLLININKINNKLILFKLFFIQVCCGVTYIMVCQ
jgi:hypothetical protein